MQFNRQAHRVLPSSFESWRVAVGFLDTGGGGAFLEGAFKVFLSRVLVWLGETPDLGLGDSGSSFFLRAGTGLQQKGRSKGQFKHSAHKSGI